MTQTIAGLTPVVVFSSQYSVVGLRTELSATIGGVDDFVNAYAYDALGRLTQLIQTGVVGGDSVADKRVDLTYDAASRYSTITRYANLAGTQEVATGTYTFDPLGRLTSLIYTQPNSTGLPFYGWTYDAAGNMLSMTSIDGKVDYAHDDTNQLTDADYDYQTDEGYTYDENGNRVTANGSTYVTGDANQLLSDGVYTYEYDAEGNRTLKYVDEDSSGTVNSGDTDITYYYWDHRNRLTRVLNYDHVSGSGSNLTYWIAWDVYYTYDYANRLIVRSRAPACYDKFIYVYAGGQIVAQFDNASSNLAATDLSHRYLWNPQAVDQLLSDEQIHWDSQEEEFVTDELLWALTDHLNSVRDLATYDSQQDETTVATHRIFDAFGNESSSTGSAECLFGYTGKLFDADTELQNNWNNWYDAALGRWLSEDKAKSDVNLTRYCANNPTILVDPMGMMIFIGAEPAIPLQPWLTPKIPVYPRIYIPPPQPFYTPPTVPVAPIQPAPPVNGPAEPKPIGPNPNHYKPGYPSAKPWKHPETNSDCTKDELASLTSQVNKNCPGHGYVDFPKPSAIWSIIWSCEELEDLKDKWERCAEARRKREYKCFRGGNFNHQVELGQAEYQSSYAYYLLRYWECPGYEPPPLPIPVHPRPGQLFADFRLHFETSKLESNNEVSIQGIYEVAFS